MFEIKSLFLSLMKKLEIRIFINYTYLYVEILSYFFLLFLKSGRIRYETNISTDGIDIGSWNSGKGKNQIKFSTFDFGGQEIFYPTHQFFLTSRCVYIVAFRVDKVFVLWCFLCSNQTQVVASKVNQQEESGMNRICHASGLCWMQEKRCTQILGGHKYHNLQAIRQ